MFTLSAVYSVDSNLVMAELELEANAGSQSCIDLFHSDCGSTVALLKIEPALARMCKSCGCL